MESTLLNRFEYLVGSLKVLFFFILMESTLSLTSTEYIAGGTGKPSLPEESLGRTEQFPYVSSELHSEGSFDP